jgi:hypothetical protein
MSEQAEIAAPAGQQPGSLKKIQEASPREICARVKLSDEALELIEGAADAPACLRRLMDAKRYADAAHFLAGALPRREAVWWACTAARIALPPEAKPAIVAALDAAEAWVFRPNEETRRATKGKADAANLDNPAAWSAMAAFWSGGSISDAGGPAIEPDVTLLPLAVSGAVQFAAVQRDPIRADEQYQLLLAAGIDIAGGGTGRRKAS